MAAFDANNVDGLNSFLATSPYLNGWTPCDLDSALFKQVKSAPGTKHPHAQRWYKNIASFSDSERGAWPKAGPSAGAPPKGKDVKEEEEEEEVDLFGSDDEEDDEEKERIKQERLQAYAAKKSKKPGPIAKSSVVLDVKPWDDEVDMAQLEHAVRQIATEGLLWGAGKLVPVAFGIKKLQIGCVVEDEKVSIDWLEEQITEMEDFVQSVDVAAFNKI